MFSCHVIRTFSPDGCLPDVKEYVLIDLVTFCQSTLNLRHDTIKLYLAGIRFYSIKSNNCNILKDTLQLPYISRAINKTQANFGKGLRLPITFTVLQHLCMCLFNAKFSPFIDAMLLAAFTTAFYGFLRCGEFTV